MLPQGYLLSVLICLPNFGVAATLLLSRKPEAARWLALAVAVATLLIGLPLYTAFDMASPAMQFVQDLAWIPAFGIRYHLGVVGI